jgi:hypothetical protein
VRTESNPSITKTAKNQTKTFSSTDKTLSNLSINENFFIALDPILIQSPLVVPKMSFTDICPNQDPILRKTHGTWYYFS